jgi:MFS family permease
MYRHTEYDIVASTAMPPKEPSVAALVPIMAVVLIAFLIIGLALPVLPLHVHQDLGFGAFIVGLVTGSQFGASLLSRVSAGHYADRRGPKRAVVVGRCSDGRSLARAESFIITGAVSWGLVLVGTKNAGRVIAWIGMAMFAALALGAPLGTALYSARGFAGVAIAATLMPLLTVALVGLLSPVPPQHGARPSLRTVAAAVWLPGFGAALSSIGFGAITAFSSLLSAQRGWSPVWLMFTAFGLALVAARLMLGHVPDRLGGARVALVCVLIEAVGLALIWFAQDRASAATGAALAGFGYSLVYPGLGAEAVRRAPPQSRGLAMGAYTVFLDVALGFGSPTLGLVAGRFGLDAAFLVSALIALGAELTGTLRNHDTVRLRDALPSAQQGSAFRQQWPAPEKRLSRLGRPPPLIQSQCRRGSEGPRGSSGCLHQRLIAALRERRVPRRLHVPAGSRNTQARRRPCTSQRSLQSDPRSLRRTSGRTK